MGKAVKTPKEGRTKASRKQYRKSLGKLKDLTVQPKTKERYRNSLKQFFDFLKKENLSIPHKGKLWMIWCQITWSSCGPRVKDELLPVPSWQECRITILSKKNCLPGSWRLPKTWAVHETPSRAPPLTEEVLKAMVGCSVLREKKTFFGLSLRTGELLSLQAWQIHMTSRWQPAVINLGLTKSGKRQGAAESITLTDLSVIQVLWDWKQNVAPHTYLIEKPRQWRALCAGCISKLK